MPTSSRAKQIRELLTTCVPFTGATLNVDLNAKSLVNVSGLGIGTTSPTSTIGFGSNIGTIIIHPENSLTDVVGVQMTLKAGNTIAGTAVDNVNGGNLVLSAGAATGNATSNILFYTSQAGVSGKVVQTNTLRMQIDANGNVGIGMTPVNKLDVTGAAGITTSLTTPIIYGSTAANGDLVLNGTSHGTKTSSFITLQPNGGNVAIGTPITSDMFNVTTPITGATFISGIASYGQIKSDVTGLVRYFVSQSSTEAAAFTLDSIYHYEAKQGVFGAGSVVTTQVGYQASSSLIGASINYGFWGAIPSGTNRWNCYMSGTAQNYFEGNTGVGLPIALAKLHSQSTTEQLRIGYDANNYYSHTTGSTGITTIAGVGSASAITIEGGNQIGSTVNLKSTSAVGTSLGQAVRIYGGNNGTTTIAQFYNNGNIDFGTTAGAIGSANINISKPLTGATNSYGVYLNPEIQSGVTTNARMILSAPSTVAASFNVSGLIHFQSFNAVLGAGSSVTTQTGFLSTDLTVATNNYGFRGVISSGTNKYNNYMDGTAQNYFEGNVGIGLPIALAKLHSQSTTEQLRIGYDASNYYSTTVGNTGGVTYTAVGSGAKFTFNKDAFINTLTIGLGTAQIATNTAIGWNVFNAITTGSYNTSVGYDSMPLTTTGERNAAFGMTALAANTTGSYNAAFGKDSLANNIGGNYNTGIGHGAGFNISTGSNNTFSGYNTGAGITTGSNNTIMGANVTGLSATLANNIIIADGAGTIRLQVDSSGNFAFTGGTVTTEALTSDQTWTITINGVTKKVLIKS